MNRLPVALPFLLFTLVACDDTDSPLEGCEDFEFTLAPAVAAPHVSCSSIACGNGTNPPTAGPHCGTTLSCRVFDSEQPPCVWLHNLEHGHAVFLYDCPEGCPEEVAKLVEAQKTARTGSNGVLRALVAPSQGLPKRVAALLWRRAYLTDSADPAALRCLLQLQDAEAPEPGLTCSP
ncbi:DUF3105 domain-containing protein [Stigmatella sp. ncwal1]|uniref:DUF3105 domain-containing protein n=1 Tax=Stigmatella ashevillensis TaxID=2995309 RepID=A0ABT5CZS9_9BACT|nr:DUF3105 domain-containing protein [Stigmatella ashevillena]MDC0706924.1 DUF3105 domain-containing protein [Stigmatella ashevillena]